MRDFEMLQARIARFAALDDTGTPEGRKLATGPSLTPLQNVLREIAETERPRRLSFGNHRREEISFHVRSGSILRVVTPTTPELSDRIAILLDQPLSESDAAHRPAVSAALAAFCLDATDLHVRSAILDLEEFSAHRGISSTLLVPPAEDNPGQARRSDRECLETFIEQSADTLIAYVVSHGAVIDRQGGPDAQAKKLLAFAEAEISTNDNPSHAPGCRVFSNRDPKGHAIFWGHAGASMVVARINGERTADHLTTWQSSFAPGDGS